MTTAAPITSTAAPVYYSSNPSPLPSSYYPATHYSRASNSASSPSHIAKSLGLSPRSGEMLIRNLQDENAVTQHVNYPTTHYHYTAPPQPHPTNLYNTSGPIPSMNSMSYSPLSSAPMRSTVLSAPTAAPITVLSSAPIATTSTTSSSAVAVPVVAAAPSYYGSYGVAGSSIAPSPTYSGSYYAVGSYNANRASESPQKPVLDKERFAVAQPRRIDDYDVKKIPNKTSFQQAVVVLN